MSLNLDSLKKSIDALQRSILVAETQMSGLNLDIQETIRAGVIQSFEVAYEQSWKMIQRWIKNNQSAVEAENPRTRKDLFRMAASYGLIKGPLPWFQYGESRNLTAHTYDQEKADDVYHIAQRFLPDACYLFEQLELLND